MFKIKFFPPIMTLCIGLFINDAVLAQTKIGVFGPNEEPRFSEIVEGLTEGLQGLGYAENDLEIVRGAVERGDKETADTIAKSFSEQGINTLVAIGSKRAKIARKVSSDYQIVFITPGDPVKAGLAKSNSNPGGNMTALTTEYPELSGKRLELLQRLSPSIKRVAALYDPRDSSPVQGFKAAEAAAPNLAIELIGMPVTSSEEVSAALAALPEDDIHAILAIPGGLPTKYFDKIIQAANQHNIPTMFHAHVGATQDALISYGSTDRAIARQAARAVDKILNGTNAGNLPIERPTDIRLTVNLKTAKAIGFRIPPKILIQAVEVIR